MNNVRYEIVKAWPTDAVIELYRAGGWWRESEATRAAIPRLIAGSYRFMVATVNGSVVGMARAISDGASDAYIQDVVVLPEYRRRGIGQELIRRLVEECTTAGVNWIGLIGEPGTGGFYEALGFRPMAGFVPLRFPTSEHPA